MHGFPTLHCDTGFYSGSGDWEPKHVKTVQTVTSKYLY